MFFHLDDNRKPLESGTVVTLLNQQNDSVSTYVIDREAGRGGLAITYIAYEKENPARFVALKELFPRSMENAWAERDESGKIVLKRLYGRAEVEEAEKIWAPLQDSFRHEVRMAEKAGVLYQADGSLAKQNNPDVLHIAGPYVATNQNSYLVIDTYDGESLETLIQKGWDSPDVRGQAPNHRLAEILEILKKVTVRLSGLHGDSGLYHLDLSTANIYVTRRGGGTQSDPYIIDYGSAYSYERDDSADYGPHRFTCNPFSAPEVQALAQWQNLDCGYLPDASSDTYSVAGILFYAVLGKIYSIDMRFESEWKERIRSFYPSVIYGAFADTLIDFLEVGLASGQQDRFGTAKQLLTELTVLSELFANKGYLSKIDPDERMAYLILHRYPLYEYANEEEINVLCLGSGEFVRRMVAAMISTGQMPKQKLRISVISERAEQYREDLLSDLPELANYSNLSGRVDNPYEYVHFDFENITFPFDDESALAGVCDGIANTHRHYRYAVISLGSNNRNVNLARLYGSALGGYTDQNCVIHYHMGEDAAQNWRSDVSVDSVADHITLASFSEREYAKDVVELGRIAFRVHYLYEKLSNPAASKEKALGCFIEDAYSQKSSAASALHLQYKLASVGVWQRSDQSEKAEAIKAYSNALKTQKNVLMELEHRRWLMYMIADGYRLPDMDTIDEYCFETLNGKFNKGFKYPAEKYHHCLVPCSTDGIRLRGLPKADWEFASFEEIEQTDYDPLDQMSLKVHLLAKLKIQRGYVAGRICSILRYWVAPQIPNDRIGEKKKLEKIINWFDAATVNAEVSGADKKLENLQLMFEDMGKNISYWIGEIKKELAIYREYTAYVDYKAPDETIVDNLLWLCYVDEEIHLIKMLGTSMVENVASALLLEPRCVYYLGDLSVASHLKTFFRDRGDNTQVYAEALESDEMDGISEQLARLLQRLEGKHVVLDLTDTTTQRTLAVMQQFMHNDIPIILCNSVMQEIQNHRNFNDVAVYTVKSRISAKDAYELFGAVEKTPITFNVIQRLRNYMDRLWGFFGEYKYNNWDLLVDYFKRDLFSSEVTLYGLRLTPNGTEHEYKIELTKPAYRFLQKYDYDSVFRKFMQLGILLDYSVQELDECAVFTIRYPDVYTQKGIGPIISANEKLEKAIQHLLKMEIWGNGQLFNESGESRNQPGDYNIFVSSHTSHRDIYTDGAVISNIEAPLRRLNELGLIDLKELCVSPTKVLFDYKFPFLKECLAKEGNILEAYVWCKANEIGYFDDVKANFEFNWSEDSTVQNELDLVLTKGLTTLVVSCKAAKYNKHHLYEVRYLADRFSVNSKAVIIYSSNMAFNGDHITSDIDAVRERAKAMGIHLIDADVLDSGRLGEALIEIAEGTYRW